MSSGDFKKIHEYVFHDGFYKKPTPNITQVAAHYGLNPRNISIAISDQGYENFKHYIKESLTVKVLKSYSIEAIASDCRFNSTPTFYRAFKKKYNQTPTDFLKK
jgi:AraC-like DNA-binding protein